MDLKMKLENIDRIRANWKRGEKRVDDEARQLVDIGTTMMLEKAKEFTSLADHTLKDLAKLGHPYALRFGKDALHPDYLVHTQSGTLRAGLQRTGPTKVGTAYEGTVFNSTWYDPFVQLGTSKMRPRPYMAEVAIVVHDALVQMGQRWKIAVMVSTGLARG